VILHKKNLQGKKRNKTARRTVIVVNVAQIAVSAIARVCFFVGGGNYKKRGEQNFIAEILFVA